MAGGVASVAAVTMDLAAARVGQRRRLLPRGSGLGSGLRGGSDIGNGQGSVSGCSHSGPGIGGGIPLTSHWQHPPHHPTLAALSSPHGSGFPHLPWKRPAHLPTTVLTTKFGNPRIGDEEEIKMEFEMEIIPKTE